jgi:hypothetical protein
MQPENTPQLPANYLDQIAPPEKPNRGFSKKQLLIFTGLGAALVLAVALMMLTSVLKNNHPTEMLAARFITVQKVVDDSTSKLKNSQLRALNSDLKLYLVDVMREAESAFATSGVDIKDINPNVTDQENPDELLERLEDERLNARYDRSYAREMTALLETTLIQMKDIYNKSSSQPLKDFLQKTLDNLEPIKEQFESIKL